jgi:hypothetical protein
MNQTCSILLRMCGLNRPKPKTRFGLYLRRSERLLSLLLIAYIGLHIYPQVLFAHSITTDGITLYSRSRVPPEASVYLARTAALVQRSELAVAGRREKIFVCDSPWIYRLFNPRGSHAFAFHMHVTNHVFVAAADFTRGVAIRPGPDFNTRSLPSVLAHEITHGLIEHRLGFLRSLRLPDWVAEGYCEHVAQESTFPASDGFSLIEAGRSHPSRAFQYFVYRQMIRHLIEDKHLTFKQVVARAADYSDIEREMRAALKSRTTQ